MLHDGKEVSPTGYDAVRVFNEKGTDRFTIGLDVNDGYKFKVSLGGALGSNDFVTVTPAGQVGVVTTGPDTDFDVTRSRATGPVGMQVRNLYPTGGAGHANIQAITEGASAGDPTLHLTVRLEQDWHFGIDNDDDDKLKIGPGWGVGSNDTVTMTTGGDVGFGTTGPEGPVHIVENAIGGETAQAWANTLVIEGVNAGLTIKSATGGEGHLVFGDFDNSWVGGMKYNHPSDLLYFRTAGGWRAVLDSAGLFGVKTIVPTEGIDVNHDAIRLRQPQTPATAGAVGTTGMICWSTGHIYIAVGTNEWERAALSSW